MSHAKIRGSGHSQPRDEDLPTRGHASRLHPCFVVLCSTLDVLKAIHSLAGVPIHCRPLNSLGVTVVEAQRDR